MRQWRIVQQLYRVLVVALTAITLSTSLYAFNTPAVPGSTVPTPKPYEPMPVKPLDPMQDVTLDPEVLQVRDNLVKKGEEIKATLEGRVGSSLTSGAKLKTLNGYMDATGARPNVLNAKIPDICVLDPTLPHCQTDILNCEQLGGTWVNGKCDFGGGGGGGIIISNFEEVYYLSYGISSKNKSTGEEIYLRNDYYYPEYQDHYCPWGGNKTVTGYKQYQVNYPEGYEIIQLPVGYCD